MKEDDKYKTKKIKLCDIIRSKDFYDIIIDASKRINKLVIYTYQFLWLFILHEYHIKKYIPKIDVKLISFIFYMFKELSNGPKPKHELSERIYYVYDRFFFPKCKISGLN